MAGIGVTVLTPVRTGQAHRSLSGHTAPVTCLQFDENNIITGSLDKTIRVSHLIAALFEYTLMSDMGHKNRRNHRDPPIRTPRDFAPIRHEKSTGMHGRERHRSV